MARPSVFSSGHSGLSSLRGRRASGLFFPPPPAPSSGWPVPADVVQRHGEEEALVGQRPQAGALAQRVDADQLRLHVDAGVEQLGEDQVADGHLGPVLFGGPGEGQRRQRGLLVRADLQLVRVAQLVHHRPDDVVAPGRHVLRRVGQKIPRRSQTNANWEMKIGFSRFTLFWWQSIQYVSGCALRRNRPDLVTRTSFPYLRRPGPKKIFSADACSEAGRSTTSPGKYTWLGAVESSAISLLFSINYQRRLLFFQTSNPNSLIFIGCLK